MQFRSTPDGIPRRECHCAFPVWDESSLFLTQNAGAVMTGLVTVISRALMLFFPVILSSVMAAEPSEQLQQWLQQRPLSDEVLSELLQQQFAEESLTADQAQVISDILWRARLEYLRIERKPELDAREIVLGDLKMPFWYKSFGEAPATGRRLFISMHGGGGAPAAVNDQQYENQKRLYQPEEGIYLVPRAATNTWNLWHQGHIDQFFESLITDMVVFENVDPDRVYFMGYSAGGDGVYQLAPRMADRLAAAAMMAGHPNEARPEGLRNIGFTLHMGADDKAYNRNTIAADWGKRLEQLQKEDPSGYVHEVTLHPNRGHWMNLQDAVAVPWMSKFQRTPWPKKVVWVQDDVVHSRFYWLQTDPAAAKAGDEVVAEVVDGVIRISRCSAEKLTLLLHDDVVSLDGTVKVVLPDGLETEHSVKRTLKTMATCLRERNDYRSMARSTIELSIAK